jgi:hypothetical protein
MSFVNIFILALTSLHIHAAGMETWNRVYLVSHPRSGNHWVRFLIEEATHIATSSIYRDSALSGGVSQPHISEVFPWGGYCADHGFSGDCRYRFSKDFDPRRIKNNMIWPFCFKELPERYFKIFSSTR